MRGETKSLRTLTNNINRLFWGVELEVMEEKAVRFKVYKGFIPCPVDYGDELYPNGMFEFNITKIAEYIEKNLGTIGVETVALADFPREFSSIDEERVDKVDVSMPVITAEISPGRYNLIDGNHRVEKARRMGLATVPAYKLTSRQHMKFLTSKKAYETYIGYWNSKL